MKRILILITLISYGFTLKAQQTLPGGSKVISNTFYQAPDSSIYQYKGPQYLPKAYLGLAVLDGLGRIPLGQLNNKLYDDYSSYSILRNLGYKDRNAAMVLIGDSNGEGYVDNNVGVGNNHYFNILAHEIQKIQGSKSAIGFTNFGDPARYGLTISGNTNIIPYGPTKSGIYMEVNSKITFQASTDFVELWYWSDPTAGSLEFRRNGVLYRTLNASGPHKEGQASFTGDLTYKTSSNDLATYEIKCTSANVFISALFKQLTLADGKDVLYFMRAAVSGKTFQNFDLSQLRKTTALASDKETLYLLALGTNSIYNSTVATSSVQFATDLTLYIDSLKSSKSNVIYLMPPKSYGSSFPAILEPYENYYQKADSVCTARGVPIIDLNFLGPSSIFGTDGLHYSIQGHRKIADFIINQIAKIELGIRNINITGNSKGLQSGLSKITYDGHLLGTVPSSILGVVDDKMNQFTPNAVKTYLELQNVDNVSDLNKPVSALQQTALNSKANDNSVVHNSGVETNINGEKRFISTLTAGNLITGGNLSVSGTSTFTGRSNYPSLVDSYYGDPTGNGIGIYFNTSNNYMRFYNGTGGNNILSINRTNGYTGIGTDSPLEALDVNGKIRTNSLFIIDQPSQILSGDILIRGAAGVVGRLGLAGPPNQGDVIFYNGSNLAYKPFVLSTAAAFDPPSITPGSVATLSTVPLTGVSPGDVVLVGDPGLAGSGVTGANALIITGYCVSPNVVVIAIHNAGTVSVDVPSYTYNIRVIK